MSDKPGQHAAPANPRRDVTTVKPRWDGLGIVVGVALFVVFAAAIVVPLVLMRDTGTEEVVTATVELSAHHLIVASDVTVTAVPEGSAPEALSKKADAEGAYTLVAIPAGKTVTAAMIEQVNVGKPDPAAGGVTVSVGIPATAAMAFGGDLQAGDTVDLLVLPAGAKDGAQPTPWLFAGVMVEAVHAVTPASDAADDNASRPFVIVVALPEEQRLEFAEASVGATILVTK